MTKMLSAVEFLPQQQSLPTLKAAALECRGCELYREGSQTVFGEGNRKARVMLIGEMPGDREDKEGRPFVGPAGRLLDDILAEARIDRTDVYVTNAVKHFHHEQVGPRRLHKTPKWQHIKACRPWLMAEMGVIKPKAIMCLGATAAQSLLGRSFRLTKARGQLQQNEWADVLLATYHPAAVLRAPSSSTRAQMRQQMLNDMKLLAKHLS